MALWAPSSQLVGLGAGLRPAGLSSTRSSRSDRLWLSSALAQPAPVTGAGAREQVLGSRHADLGQSSCGCHSPTQCELTPTSSLCVPLGRFGWLPTEEIPARLGEERRTEGHTWPWGPWPRGDLAAAHHTRNVCSWSPAGPQARCHAQGTGCGREASRPQSSSLDLCPRALCPSLTLAELEVAAGSEEPGPGPLFRCQRGSWVGALRTN